MFKSPTVQYTYSVVLLINVFSAYGGWGDLRDRRLCMMGFDGFEGPEAFLWKTIFRFCKFHYDNQRSN